MPVRRYNKPQKTTLNMTLNQPLFSLLRRLLGRYLNCTLALLTRTALSVPLYTATFTVNDLGDTQDAIPSDGTCATAVNVRALRAVFFPS